jgi:hypothetical protein
MYLLRKRTVDCVVLPSSLEPDRKNLAVHVSLSSNLHNVKERTPCAALAGGVSGSSRFPNSGEQNLVSGLPAAGLPFQKALISGSNKCSASSAWRVVFKTFQSVNTPFSTFVPFRIARPEPKPEATQSLIS